MKPGDLIKYKAWDVGIIVRAVTETDDAWNMQTFGVPAYWVRWCRDNRTTWTYKKDLTALKKGN